MGADRSREVRKYQRAAGLVGDTAPKRSAAVASCSFDDGLLIASELGMSPVILDPITAIVWRSLDGTSTMGALAEDLSHAVNVSKDEALSLMTRLIEKLADNALVSWEKDGFAPLPRRLHGHIPPDSCIGQQLGLAGAGVLRIVGGSGRAVTVGSNLSEVLDPLRNREGVTELADDAFGLESEPCFFVRGSRSPSGRPRAHYLFDQMGNRLHLSWSAIDAADVLLRTTLTALEVPQNVALECLAFRGRSGALLVHPAIREIAIDSIRSMPEIGRVQLLPSVVLGLDQMVVTVSGEPALTIPISAILIPAVRGEISQIQQILHLALRWDDSHLSALRDLAGVAPLVEVDQTATVEQLRSLIERA